MNNKTIKDDETFKAAAHGLLLGAMLPVLLYSVSRKNWKNISIYSALALFEVYNIIGHVIDSEIE